MCFIVLRAHRHHFCNGCRTFENFGPSGHSAHTSRRFLPFSSFLFVFNILLFCCVSLLLQLSAPFCNDFLSVLSLRRKVLSVATCIPKTGIFSLFEIL
mmetsp:Transcript_56535/g.149037  ORF Transcript_56535/g.149037 Transcript_56535/m.149037 type:complete len:98 (-) Transcript_56535:3216-3509(-)